MERRLRRINENFSKSNIKRFDRNIWVLNFSYSSYLHYRHILSKPEELLAIHKFSEYN